MSSPQLTQCLCLSTWPGLDVLVHQRAEVQAILLMMLLVQVQHVNFVARHPSPYCPRPHHLTRHSPHNAIFKSWICHKTITNVTMHSPAYRYTTTCLAYNDMKGVTQCATSTWNIPQHYVHPHTRVFLHTNIWALMEETSYQAASAPQNLLTISSSIMTGRPVQECHGQWKSI